MQLEFEFEADRLRAERIDREIEEREKRLLPPYEHRERWIDDLQDEVYDLKQQVLALEEGNRVLQEELDLERQRLSIEEVCVDAYANAVDKGFKDPPPSPAELIALIHSEASEALEDIRAGKFQESTLLCGPKQGKPVGLPSELADIVIRVCDMAEQIYQDDGHTLARAIRKKMAYNRTREFRHGGKSL